MADDRIDGFLNALSGLGGSVDRLSGATVASIRNSIATQSVLETLYYEDDLAARMVDAIIDDAVRQGIELDREQSVDDGAAADSGTDVKQAGSAILRRMRELRALERVTEGARWGRLYGGGAVLIVLDDGNHSAPVALGRKIVSLSALDRWEMTPVSYFEDVMSPQYGEVETWRVNRRGARTTDTLVVHESRLLRFEGLPVSSIERARQDGWSLSVLTRAYEVLRDGQQNWRSVSNILSQATQPIFKIKGLAEMIANGQDEQLTRRMEAANLVRSILRAVLIDAEGEEFKYENASLGGLDVILDKTWQRLAAAGEMPVTRLMGMSPAGLNATGESDVRGWYDSVQSYREQDLGPQIERLVRIVAAELGDQTPSEWVVRWPSLWQMSPTEQAEHEAKIASTDKTYIDAGVLLPEEVAVTRFGGGTYDSGPVQIDASLRETPAEPPAPPAPPVEPPQAPEAP